MVLVWWRNIEETSVVGTEWARRGVKEGDLGKVIWDQISHHLMEEFIECLGYTPVFFFFFFFFFFSQTHSMWKILDHGLNPCHRSNNTRSLTCWTTRELLCSTLIFKSMNEWGHFHLPLTVRCSEKWGQLTKTPQLLTCQIQTQVPCLLVFPATFGIQHAILNIFSHLHCASLLWHSLGPIWWTLGISASVIKSCNKIYKSSMA